MRYLIGFLLIIVGGVSTAVTEIAPLCIIAFVGVFLFASFPAERVFVDYVLANSKACIMRKRSYMNFLPVYITFWVFSLGKVNALILYKEEYFRTTLDENEKVWPVQITRAEYVRLRNEQRHIYSTQLLSREFINGAYSLQDIGYTVKKWRVIILSAVAVLMLFGLADAPNEWPFVLCCEAVFVYLILLWLPDYKDAKILQTAYDRAMGQNVPRR